MSKQKRKLHFLINLILSFILTLFVTAFLIAAGVYTGICRHDNFVRQIGQSEYYESLYEKLTGQLQMMLKEAKLPEELGKDVIKESQVYIDGQVYITSVLEGKQPEIETDEIREKLTDNIHNYLAEKEIPVEYLKQGIEEIVDTILIDYRNTLEFKMADYFYEYSQRYRNTAALIMFGCGFGSLFLTIVFLLTNKKKYRGLRFVNYAVVSAAILNTVITFQAGKMLNDFSLEGEGYYPGMMKGYLQNSYVQGYYMSVCAVLVFILLFALTLFLKKYKK